MKTRKLLFLILLNFTLTFALNAQNKPVQDIQNMAIINSAFNSDNSILVINTASYEDWTSVIYACNPAKCSLNWGFQKIWDKRKIPGCIRTLACSPFSDKFYFIVFWNDGNNPDEQYSGLYQTDHSKGKHVNFLKVEKLDKIEGIGSIIFIKKGLYLLLYKWDGRNKYGWGYSELFQIEAPASLHKYENLNQISNTKFMSYSTAERFPKENENKSSVSYDGSYLFQATDYTLLIKDEDNRSWWNYDCVTQKIENYTTLNEAKLYGEKLDLKYSKQAANIKNHFYLILIIITFLFISSLVFFLMFVFAIKHHRGENNLSVKERNRITFEIQEK